MPALVAFRVTLRQHHSLKLLAAAEGLSIGELCRRALLSWLDQQEENDEENRRDVRG